MNRARVAALLRELADEFERGDAQPANDTPRVHKRAKQPRKRPTRLPYKPPVPSDIDVAAVKRMARKAGINLP